MGVPLITDEAVEAALTAFYDTYDSTSLWHGTSHQLSMRAALSAALGVLGPQTDTDDDELAAAWAAVGEVLPQAIGFNSLADIIRGIGKQRDAQREFKDHLAERARILTAERDRLRAASSSVVPQTLSDDETELISDALEALWVGAPNARPEIQALVERYPEWLAAGGFEA